MRKINIFNQDNINKYFTNQVNFLFYILLRKYYLHNNYFIKLLSFILKFYFLIKFTIINISLFYNFI